MHNSKSSWGHGIILFVALAFILPAVAATAEDVISKVPKLQGVLKEMHDNYLIGAKDRIASTVSSRGLYFKDGKVRVMLEIAPGATLDESRLLTYGIEVERKHEGFWRVLAPVASLRRMAEELEGVSYIRTPHRAHPETLSEGVADVHADTWHTAGWTGTGVKVAIIDGNFANLANTIAAGDLPAGLIQQNYAGVPFESGTNRHGTAVAEIVYDFVPGATMYLIKIDDESDLTLAKDYCIANGINVINTSLGYYNAGDYAGNGPLCDIVNDAYANGILWVKSAGNNARSHYRAVFSDGDADNWHNFSGSTETNTLINIMDGTTTIPAGSTIELYLSWGWPTSAQNYDLYLYRGSTEVAHSTDIQNGSQPPTEEIVFNVVTAGTYSVKILRVNATGTEELTLFAPSNELTYRQSAASLSQPGDATGCFTVGMLRTQNWPSGAIELWSSRGPTYDGRIKPEIVAPTNVTTMSFPGGMYWTSAAAPHAAGAAALVLSANPGFTVGQLWSYLTSNATDRAPVGQDNDWGFGLLHLGTPPVAGFAVTSPNGSENWAALSTHDITWTTSGAGALVDIDYSTDGGATWIPIFSNTPNDGTEPWVIPNTPSVNCLVRITDDDGSPSDVSNSPFTISSGGPGCIQPILSLLGYRQVSWADPLWTVQVEVRNAGPGVAKNVNVVMNEDLAWLTIPDPNCAYGDIAAGGSSWGSDSYTFDLTAHPGGSFSAWFDVTYEDDCGNQYRLRLDPEFNRDAAETGQVSAYRLGQNYPNPFNPNTTISFQLATAGPVNLGVFDVAGKLVRTLVDEHRSAGLHAVNWDGKDASGASVASGIYFYKLTAGSFTETKKMVLMR